MGEFSSELGQELFRQMSALTRTVGRLDGKIDGFLDKMHDHDARITDLDERARKVENHQYKVAGASGVIALLAGGAVSLVSHFMKG
jgi:hypothetical protein